MEIPVEKSVSSRFSWEDFPARAGNRTEGDAGIGRAAMSEASSETIPSTLQRQIADPMLVTALQTAVVVGVGVVFLMTTKPDLLGSLLTLAGAIVLGVGSALLWQIPRAVKGRGKEIPGFGEQSQ